MGQLIHITIPLVPISKKNSQQILINKATGKPFIMPSKKYREYEKSAMWFLPKGIYINVFRERFGKDIFEVYPDAIRKHIEEGLLVHDREKGRIYFSDIGLDLSNYVLSDFIID